MTLSPADIPHRRYNPLRKSWVLVSPHRAKRPWQGQQEEPVKDSKPEYDDKCYLCPRNKRINGELNPDYQSTFVFENDFSAVFPKTEEIESLMKEEKSEQKTSSSLAGIEADLLRQDPTFGYCQVICFSPKHNVTLATMTVPQIEQVIYTWQDMYREAQTRQIKYSLIFENKGATMGCSNPHAHGQVWNTSVVPEEPQMEYNALREYKDSKSRDLLVDYAALELEKKERVVYENSSFLVVVPYWAVWPFETMIFSKQRIASVIKLTKPQVADLADAISVLTRKYDKLFNTSFPYSMGIHQSFVDEPNCEYEHLRLLFYPPLLRSASVKKFQVGFEMLGMPQRDITAEGAAQRLKGL